MLKILKFLIKILKRSSKKSENTMLFINSLENKLEKFSSDNLKSMLCIHSDISNKLDLVIDDLSASTSHASDFELDSIVIKPDSRHCLFG